MKKVRVLVDHFQGSVYQGGEHIKACCKNEIISVEDETWNAIQTVFPKFFELYHEIEELAGTEWVEGRNVGIVIPIFNRPEYLKETFKCLSKTIFPNDYFFTLLLIDDCSTDKGVEPLMNTLDIQGLKIIKFTNPKNIGVGATLSKGFDYFYKNTFNIMLNLDSDVIMKPWWIKKLLTLFRKFPENIISGFHANKTHKIRKEADDYYIKDTVGGINMMFGTKIYKEVIKESFNVGENWDWEVCKRAIKHDTQFYVTKPSVIQHIGEVSVLKHVGADISEDFNTPDTPIILIQNYFTHKKKERQEEINFCLEKNVKNKFIDKIVLVIDDKKLPPITHEKIEIVHVKKRPTYSQLFDLVNKYDGIKVLTNSDIFLDETIAGIEIPEDTVYALCRYEYNKGQLRFLNFKDSQDAWIFKDKVECKEADFTMGRPGCDNAIANRLEKSGYKVKSPSLSIRAIHFHESDIRDYDISPNSPDRVPGPYLILHPHRLP